MIQADANVQADEPQRWQLASNKQKAAEPANRNDDANGNAATLSAGGTSSDNQTHASASTAAKPHLASPKASSDQQEDPVVDAMSACTPRLDAFADLCGSSNRDKLQAFIQAIFDHQKVCNILFSGLSV